MRWTSRFSVPVLLVVVASLIAIVASGTRTPGTPDLAAASELPVTTVAIDEAADHSHDASDPSIANDHSLDATAGGHLHTTDVTVLEDAAGDHSHAEPTGAIVSVDDPRLTSDQQNRARTLLIASRNSIASFPDSAALAAAGYSSVGDNSSGLQHWVNDGYTKDGRELDPGFVESFITNRSTGRTVGAMYILEPGRTMADVPDIAGELTIWHIHPTICFSTTQIWRFVSFTSNGTCPPATEPRDVPPMIHVWADDPPCGPFVGTEGHGTTTCDSHAH